MAAGRGRRIGVMNVKETTLKEKVCNAILEDIYSGTYQPGDILNEKKLVEKYQCSKSPVREALVTLVNNRVLKSMPRYGYEVTRLTMDDIKEMLDFRLYLEFGIVQTVCGVLREEQFAELEELNALCLLDDVPPRQHWEYNMDFHRTLTHYGRNGYVDEQLEACMQRLSRAYAQFRWGMDSGTLHVSDDCKHHKDILDALRHNDRKALYEALRNDLHDFNV
jgi:DNA-binding GntR family transcriptional regulator